MAEDSFGLKFILPSGEVKVFNSLPIQIGRDPANDLVLDDPAVSAYHARIVFDETIGKICIQDLDSLNGLYIGDLPTRKNLLQDGAKIGMGHSSLSFRDTGYIHPG